MFCININTHIDRKWKIMQNVFKNFFFKMFKCLMTFFYSYHYLRYFYSDYMWRHVGTTGNSLIFT